jgi:hypothetical protein
VQAQTDVVEVRRLRPGSAEVTRPKPAGTAKTGLDALGVGKAASRTERLPDSGKAIETISTKAIEWEK